MQGVYPLPMNLQYKITATTDGVHLCVWETARMSDVRVKPFLFKVNHHLSSHEEAEQVLRYYLEHHQGS
jgi:hypothetical protein